MNERALKLLLSDLLDVLRNIYKTRDIEDSIRNDDAIRDECARALGFADYSDFEKESEGL